MVQDAITHISERYATLTAAEKKLADYIITHYDSSVSMSVQELSKSAGVSAAAAVRLAQHMGFDGFKEFRIHLIKYRPEHEDFILDLKKNRGTVANQVEKVINSNIEAMRLTRDGIDYDVLTKAAAHVSRARQILLFGTGTSFVVCGDAMHKFRCLGKLTFSANDIHTASVIMANFTADDLVIGISHSGKNADTCKILSIAKSSGFHTLALTTFAQSSICSFAENILYTKTRESPLHRMAITSRISQFAMMDALVMAYLVTDYENCMSHIDRLSKQLDFIR